MSVCSNMGFLGIPVIASVFGDASIILSSIFVMMQGVFLYSLGFMLLSSEEGGGEKVSWSAIMNPAMVACILAIALFLGGVKLPSVIQGTFDLVGGLTTPLALMLVGVIISQVNVKAVVSEWRLYLRQTANRPRRAVLGAQAGCRIPVACRGVRAHDGYAGGNACAHVGRAVRSRSGACSEGYHHQHRAFVCVHPRAHHLHGDGLTTKRGNVEIATIWHVRALPDVMQV